MRDICRHHVNKFIVQSDPRRRRLRVILVLDDGRRISYCLLLALLLLLVFFLVLFCFSRFWCFDLCICRQKVNLSFVLLERENSSNSTEIVSKISKHSVMTTDQQNNISKCDHV